MVVASFHLARFPTALAATLLPRVPLDRRRLRTVPGLRFGKLLGTGAGRTMATSADLRRWAIFAVWDDDDARHAFLTTHPLSLRWDDGAAERFDVALDPLGAHGTWDGGDPFGGEGPTARAGATSDGPVAIVTRATVRWPRIRSFQAAVPGVDAHLATVEGLIDTVGIGEAPVARQATFSLWRDADAVRDFAYRSPQHAEVIRRTRDEDWYGEEWFARFTPRDPSGTWDGRRPLG